VHIPLNEEEDLRSASSCVIAGHSGSEGTGPVSCSWPVASRFDCYFFVVTRVIFVHWQANGEVIVVSMKTAPTYDFIKVRFTLEQAMNTQRGSRGIVPLVL